MVFYSNKNTKKYVISVGIYNVILKAGCLAELKGRVKGNFPVFLYLNTLFEVRFSGRKCTGYICKTDLKIL